MPEENSVAYDGSAIKTLSALEHIRLRPGMYIGRMGDGSHPDDGIYILIKEIIDNSIDEFNEAVESGTDRFGRAVFDQKLDKGPFYALHGVAKVHHTMGGIEINGKTQAIGVDGNVVEGLYAAGEVTGGIHGANRLGGNAIADVVTFGRIAGQEVVK